MSEVFGFIMALYIVQLFLVFMAVIIQTLLNEDIFRSIRHILFWCIPLVWVVLIVRTIIKNLKKLGW